MKALLLLEDGSEFVGEHFGAPGQATGEIVFNTSMTGYQEILSDPSYRGQIVTMTSPLIGNYGVNDQDFESRSLFLSGFVVREYSQQYSNWRGHSNLGTLLKQHGIVGISEVDTRALTRRLRKGGVQRGIVTTENTDRQQLLEQVRNSQSMLGADYVREVVGEASWVWKEAESNVDELDILALDTGVKYNILRSLNERGARLRVATAEALQGELERRMPDGLLLSNGPGDPAALKPIIDLVASLHESLPVFGICLGHQVLALSLGARTYKMPFGHHGGNHPVKNLLTGAVEITAQNHGFAVDEHSLPAHLQLSHVSLFDGTVEGFRHTELPISSVQYHPESAPGPHDSGYLFDQFISQVKESAQPAAGDVNA